MEFHRKELLWLIDKAKPSARMGRKAHRVSPRQPGCRNIHGY